MHTCIDSIDTYINFYYIILLLGRQGVAYYVGVHTVPMAWRERLLPFCGLQDYCGFQTMLEPPNIPTSKPS